MKKFVLSAVYFFALLTAVPVFAQEQDAEFYHKQGIEFLGKGDHTRAIEAFTEAIRLKPDYTEAYKNRGNAYFNRNELDKALDEYNQALRIDQNYVPAIYNRGMIYYLKGYLDLAIEDLTKAIALNPDMHQAYDNRGSAYYKKGDMDRAIEDLTKAIALNPSYHLVYTKRGAAYYKKGDMDRAIEDCTKAITLNPSDAGAYTNRGTAYSTKGELGRAIEDYDKAIALNPGFYLAYTNRGKAYEAKGELDRVIEDCTKAIALNPDDVDAYNTRGKAYEAKGELDRAIEDFTKIIALSPDEDIPYTNRGLAYDAKGELDRAIEDYTKAIALNPDTYQAYANRGIVYKTKGELDRAIEDYTKAIALNPDDADAYLRRGGAYYAKGELDRAIEDFSKAIALNPGDAYAYNNRGTAYKAKSDLDRAIEDHTKAIALNPDYLAAYEGRGHAYYTKGELDRAIEDLTKIIALSSDDGIAYNNRGIVYNTKGELDRAIEDYTKAIALNPDMRQTYYNRGGVYVAKGELDRAIEDYDKAIVLNPDYTDAYNGRGATYNTKGELDRAIEDFTKAIALNPDNENAYNNRGTVYKKKGDLDRAIEDFTKAIALNLDDADAYNNRGVAYKAKGEPDKAIADYKQSIEAADRSSSLLDIFYRSWKFTGSLYKEYPYLNEKIDADDFERQYAGLAREATARSIVKAEQARSGLGARGAEIMTTLIYQYYAGTDLEARFGSAGQAFAYSEGLRSRGFLEQMGTEAALRLPGISGADAKRVRELTGDIGNLQNLRAKLDPQTDAEKYADAGIQLNKAEAELATLDALISANVPRYGELRNPKPADLAAARSFCGEDRAILEYVLWDSTVDFKAPAKSNVLKIDYQERPAINSYCLVITKDGITAVRLDPDFDYLDATNELRRKITPSLYSTIPPAESSFEQERNELYVALIAPVLPHIKGVQKLLIVPDGSLAYLPFDILRENAAALDLGETYRISFSPSVSVSVLAAKTGAAQNEPLLAFGGAWYDKDKQGTDRGGRAFTMVATSESAAKPSVRDIAWRDLPGTETEVKTLQSLRYANTQPTVFLGSDVSEAKIKELSLSGTLKQYPVVHFACHGYFDETDPAWSSIIFSEVSKLPGTSTGEDGYLTIPEIAILNFDARLTLLSACETGLGQVRRGDGMVGLTRSFLVAGAERVGVSLWPISDEATVEFMAGVYRKVFEGGHKFRRVVLPYQGRIP
ncbi:hypothetical protein FACS1894200_07730 [Spirochaetia bacterium]|nr:hypothetical protein FACS1894200_07730 [Spirochaetia bacterium]